MRPRSSLPTRRISRERFKAPQSGSIAFRRMPTWRLCKLEAPAPPHTPRLELDDRSTASIAGDPVVLIGYPTGIEGILARAGDDTTEKVTANAHQITQVVSRLAAQRLIRPTTTQGHIGDVLKDKIVYDAATTSGGSGGPLFNRDGKVIGVNFAILNNFGGSNLAVPIRYADELVK